MKKPEELTRKMQELEANGDVTEEELGTYRVVLHAVNLLQTLRNNLSQYDDGEWFLHEGSDELITKVDDFLEKLR